MVDIYGNILDINHHKIPIGGDQVIGLEGNVKSYQQVRELHRRGVAFHWELNARKDISDLLIEDGSGVDYGKNQNNYSKNRSRFFIDVDKEGQFKIHIPSSSEKGNISLLAKYENVSTINPVKDDYGNNYDTFPAPTTDKGDIVLDGFGKGCVELKGNEKFVPVDRITNTPIKLGTAFHDISTTCCVPVFSGELEGKGAAIFSGPDADMIKTSVVTTSVNIDGYNTNAGGRSGTISLDGMLNLSVGANTVDRQSLWLDTAGGIISRIGRDINNTSICSQLDGNYFMQLGSPTISDDKRFTTQTGYDNSGNIKDPFIISNIKIDGSVL